MQRVYGVQFKKVGKIYNFESKNLVFNINDYCVVETSRGIEVAQITHELENTESLDSNLTLKPILRKATNIDLDKFLENTEASKIAFDKTISLITKRNLQMKLLAVDYTLDKKTMIFHYTSEDRVDFRDLLRDLNSTFKTKIELKQIGYRDSAKLCGGLGVCGRELCCSKHLTDFDSVSIKMAKNQELSLNPAKITGSCSKLLCCIKYEDDLYTELRKSMFSVGDFVKIPTEQVAKVNSINLIKSTVTVYVDGSNRTYDSKDVSLVEKGDYEDFKKESIEKKNNSKDKEKIKFSKPENNNNVDKDLNLNKQQKKTEVAFKSNKNVNGLNLDKTKKDNKVNFSNKQKSNKIKTNNNKKNNGEKVFHNSKKK